MTRLFLLTLGLLVTMSALGPRAAHAQSRLPSQIGPVALSGSVGFSSQLYGTRGVPSRRDPFLAEMYASVSASAYRFSYGLDLVLSTRESRFDQSFNRAGLNVSYKWIKVEGGDIAPNYADYGFRGVTFFGAGIELTPGPVIIALTGGRARSSIEPSDLISLEQAAYDRWLYAFKLGIGDANRTHFHLTTFYASDDSTTLRSTEQLAPVQNVNVSPSLGLHLFGGKAQVKAVGTVSAFTRDAREDTDFDLEGSGVPVWALELFTPNLTTQVDYAYKIDGQLRLSPVDLRGGFERIGPGFETLGLAASRRDFQRVQGQVRTTLLDRRLRLSVRGDHFRNNLLDLLAATRERLQLGINAQVQISEAVGLSGGFTRLANTTSVSSPDAAGSERNQQVLTFLLSPTLSLRRGDLTHNASLSGTYQDSSDPTSVGPAAAGSRYTSTNLSANYALGFASGLALTSNANLLSTDADMSSTLALSTNLGASRGFFERALTTELSGWLTRCRSSKSSSLPPRAVMCPTFDAPKSDASPSMRAPATASRSAARSA